MVAFRNVVQRGFLTPVLGLICGLSAGVMVGARLISGNPGDGIDGGGAPDPELNAVPDKPAVPDSPATALPQKTPAVKNLPLVVTNTPAPTAIVELKNSPGTGKPAEKQPGTIPVVRRASYIAFKGFEFQLFTGRYRCTLDYFDTYYFSFLADGVSEQGSQWFKFKAKDRQTDKAEIKFKLTGSCFSKLIYHVAIVESFIHFLPGNSPLEEEQQGE